MHREQAVEIIERHIDRNIASGSLVEQALSMAIDALKAQLSCEGTTSDLISRQAAIDIVVFECGKWTGLAKEISKQLKQLPPAQPEPKEGYWINGKCNLCGEHAPFWAMASTYHESNYCPNCGAKMKGATNE